MDYKRLYHIMLDASERALKEMEQQHFDTAWAILVKGEREAEEKHIEMSEDEDG